MTPPLRQLLGQRAEQRAERYLQQQGLLPLERNYRCRWGEIDLIMRDQQTLVFVEVRYRKNNDYGGALASVDPRKQSKLIRSAQHYLSTHNGLSAARFDVVALHGDDTLNWVANAFDAN